MTLVLDITHEQTMRALRCACGARISCDIVNRLLWRLL